MFEIIPWLLVKATSGETLVAPTLSYVFFVRVVNFLKLHRCGVKVNTTVLLNKAVTQEITIAGMN